VCAGGRWEGKRQDPRGDLSKGIRCKHGAEKPESHESGLARPTAGISGIRLGEGAEAWIRLARYTPAKGEPKDRLETRALYGISGHLRHRL
jgi:hypothetical protein